MEIKELVPKYKEFVRQLRREFHQYPELSMEEQETTKRIATKLDEMGIPYTIDPEKTQALLPSSKAIILGKLWPFVPILMLCLLRKQRGYPLLLNIQGKCMLAAMTRIFRCSSVQLVCCLI